MDMPAKIANPISNGKSNPYYVAVLFAIASLAALHAFWRSQEILLAILLMLAFFMVLPSRSRKPEAALFIAIALIGAVAELIGISAGAWSYSLPFGAGMPLWLPALWGMAGLFVKRTADELSAWPGKG